MSKVVVHGTFGKSELFARALLGAGFREGDIITLSAQHRETKRLQALLPDADPPISVGAAPARNNRVWRGMGPSKVLLDAAHSAGMSVGEMITSDRHLRRFPADTGLAFLNELASTQLEMLTRGRPEFVIGETASASEVLLAALCEHQQIPYVQPATLRIPGDRFGLWLGPRSEKLWRKADQTPADDKAADAYLTRWLEAPQRPFYFAVNSTRPSLHPCSLLSTVADKVRDQPGRRRYSLMRPRAMDYLQLPWLNRLRKVANAKRLAARSWDSLPDKPIAFFPLHVQPEASVDWFGDEWRDQVDVARDLAEALDGLDIALAVKDHSNFIWNRGPRFHDALRSLPNVVLVDPALDSARLAHEALFTFTVSGTVALECGLKGATAVTVGAHPWADLPTVQRVRGRRDLTEYVQRRSWLDDAGSADVGEWFRRYWGSSYSGTIADSYSFPDSLSDTNTASLANALTDFRNSL